MHIAYQEHDFIGLFMPDPPWVYVPKENDAFLQPRYLPMVNSKTCSYCESAQVSAVDAGPREWPERMQSFMQNFQISAEPYNRFEYRCPDCGFWATAQVDTRRMVNGNELMLVDLIAAQWAKMKTLDTGGLEPLTGEIETELARITHHLFSPPLSKISAVVQSCVQNHFPCQVTCLGGGREIAFLVDASQPALVLVRPDESSKQAQVRLVREILWLEQSQGRGRALWVAVEPRFVTEDVHLPVLRGVEKPLLLDEYDALLTVVMR